MAKKAQASAVAAVPLLLEEAATHSIFAETGFEHDGAHYSAGIHNDVPADVARAIAAVKKAVLCERPAPRTEATEALKLGESDGKGGAATVDGTKKPGEGEGANGAPDSSTEQK